MSNPAWLADSDRHAAGPPSLSRRAIGSQATRFGDGWPALSAVPPALYH